VQRTGKNEQGAVAHEDSCVTAPFFGLESQKALEFEAPNLYGKPQKNCRSYEQVVTAADVVISVNLYAIYANGFSVGYNIPFGWLNLTSSTPRYLNTS